MSLSNWLSSRGWRVGGLREIAGPFVARRLKRRGRGSVHSCRVSPQDAAWCCVAAGSHLGVLAGRDLAARCAEWPARPEGRAVSQWRERRAGADRRVVNVTVGGRDHPHERGPVAARGAEPARGGRPASSGPDPPGRGAGRRPGGPQGGPGTRVRDPRRAARQDHPTPPGAAEAGLSRAEQRLEVRPGPGDAGREGPAAQARQPGRRRASPKPGGGRSGRPRAFS